MTRTQILELESKFKAYKLKSLFKRLGLMLLSLMLLSPCFYLFKLYEDKQARLKLAYEEKRRLEKRLELAYINAKKAELLRQKELKEQEALQEQLNSKEKFSILAYDLSTKKLEREFKQNASLKTALLLARLHFENKDYENALFYSHKANELDKKETSTWLIYAKSKFALGKKEEAKRILQGFMRHYVGDFNEDISYMLE